MVSFIELRQILAILVRHWWLLVIGAVLGGGLGYAVSRMQTPVYEATTTMIVGSIANSNLQKADVQLSEQLVLTYADLVRRQPVLQGAINALYLKDNWQSLRDRVRVSAVENTQLLEISVRAGSPMEAQQTANEIGRQVTQFSSTASQRDDDAKAREFVTKRLQILQNNIEAGQRRLDALQLQLTSAVETSITEIPKIQDEIKVLQASMTDWDSTYSRLKASIVVERPDKYLNVVEVAEANPNPVVPRTPINTLLAMIVGLCLASGLTFLWEHLDDRLRSPEDVTQSLGLITLGAINPIKGKTVQQKLISQHDTFAPASEDYRLLRSKLQFLWADWSRRVIVVTSPVSSELNSLIVANLGIVLAQAGLKTVIVDANLREPRQHKLFQLPNHQGLTKLFASSTVELDQALQITPVKNLQVLTAGASPTLYPSEMLGSSRMKQILDELAETSDVVLCDSAQTLSIADTPVLSSLVDGVVLFIEAGKTRRGIAEQAVQHLHHANAQLLGVVLSPISTKALALPKHELQAPVSVQGKNSKLSEARYNIQGVNAKLPVSDSSTKATN